jgi:hypothetical protein
MLPRKKSSPGCTPEFIPPGYTKYMMGVVCVHNFLARIQQRLSELDMTIDQYNDEVPYGFLQSTPSPSVSTIFPKAESKLQEVMFDGTVKPKSLRTIVNSTPMSYASTKAVIGFITDERSTTNETGTNIGQSVVHGGQNSEMAYYLNKVSHLVDVTLSPIDNMIQLLEADDNGMVMSDVSKMDKHMCIHRKMAVILWTLMQYNWSGEWNLRKEIFLLLINQFAYDLLYPHISLSPGGATLVASSSLPSGSGATTLCGEFFQTELIIEAQIDLAMDGIFPRIVNSNYGDDGAIMVIGCPPDRFYQALMSTGVDWTFEKCNEDSDGSFVYGDFFFGS